MPDQLDWKLLDRYLAGEATPDERARVHRWIEALPGRAELLHALRQGQERASSTAEVDVAWQRVASRMRADGARSMAGARDARVLPLASAPSKTTRVFAPARRSTRWLVPAAATLLVAASLTIWRARGGTGNSSPAPQPREALRELTTPNGRRASLMLADGSRVVLNAGSRLRYAADFGRAGVARDVHLDGEAYFEVTHHGALPFRVHAGHALAQDLGTRFSVRAYAGTPAQVVVAEGKVSLRANQPAARDSAVLGPGQRGRLGIEGSSTTSSVVVDSVDADRYLSWIRGTLTLDGAPLRETLPVIERWFDVDIRIADSTLADRRVTAVFRDQSLSQVLDALAVALGARYERSSANPRVVTFFAARRRS